jgi:large subunit ribosomal protein L15
MKFNDLIITPHTRSKRVGRGIASGKGKTAGRGTKGYGSRTGSKARPGFAGGQNPLMQQLPKLPGFKSLRPKATLVFTGELEQFAGKTVDSALLAEHRLIPNAYVPIKLLAGRGDLTKKVTVKLQAASGGAIAALEAVGGSFEAVARSQRQAAASDKAAE